VRGAGEVSFHILRYGAQRLAEGDVNALRDLGFSLTQIRALEQLTLKELDHLSRLGAHFMEVRVDAQCFTTALSHVRRERANDVLQDELIRAGAPAGMMYALFGITGAQYALRRKLLDMAGAGVGRPPTPSEADEASVWHAWQAHADLPVAQRYLATARTARRSLGTVWSVLKAVGCEPPEVLPRSGVQGASGGGALGRAGPGGEGVP
jgi:hypothetical protein